MNTVIHLHVSGKCWSCKVFRAMFGPRNWGSCYRCEGSWKYHENHTTRDSDQRGCFPLCERCWRALKTPENRLPYYRDLWESWMADYRDSVAKKDGFYPDGWEEDLNSRWPAIEAAVKDGG